jgi:glycogen operon protein
MTPPAPAASSVDFIKPDRIYPDMGAVFDGHGTHFAVFSENAQAIELCLFGPGGRDEQRLELPHREGPVFSGYLPGVRPGQQYGYRAHGPYDPAQGHRFNPNKLLLDPYARATAGRIMGRCALGL